MSTSRSAADTRSEIAEGIILLEREFVLATGRTDCSGN
jgi:hypothetical protein